jgi:hypothetical protein
VTTSPNGAWPITNRSKLWSHKKLPWCKKSDYNLKYLSCIGVIAEIGANMAHIVKQGGMAAMIREEGRPESS